MVRRSKRRCRNCPDEEAVKPTPNVATNKYADRVLEPRLVTQVSESERLWNHVLFGTGTCIGMIEGYAKLGLPGDPAPQIQQLIQRLQGVLKGIKSNENLDSED